MGKKIKYRVLIWDCERCGVHNESPINVCSFCQFIRVRSCLISLAGGEPFYGEVNCMKCKKTIPGNYDLRKIGGRPKPLQTLYAGTLKRIAEELGEMVPGVLEAVKELELYVGMQLCTGCHPSEGGILAHAVKKETVDERINREVLAKEVREKLEDKMAADPTIGPEDMTAVARSIIRRMDEDLAYDAEDRRVRHMIREARPVKFSLMKKNLSGDDLMSAQEDVKRRLEQFGWKYQAARNQITKLNLEVDALELEKNRTFGKVKLFENLSVSENPEERIASKDKLQKAKRRYSFLDRKIDEIWESIAVHRNRARKSIEFIRKYRSLLFELRHVYEIRWSTILSKGDGRHGFGYEIRQDAFGVEEVNTPMIGLVKCSNCRIPSDKVHPFPVRLESTDDSGKKTVRTVDTVFLCPRCYKAERSGKKKEVSKKVKKEIQREAETAETMTRNLDKEWSEHLRMTASEGIHAVMEAIGPKCFWAVPIENIDYKNRKLELWVIAFPKPGEKLPKEMIPDHKVLVRILSVPSGNFRGAYLWCSLWEEERETWEKEAKARCFSFSKRGLELKSSWVDDPWEIASTIGTSLPKRHFEGEGLKKFWRTIYELGGYLTMPWEAKLLVVGPSDPEYDRVLSEIAQREWMKEVESFKVQEEAHDGMWYSYGIVLRQESKTKSGNEMFAMVGSPSDGTLPQPKDADYFKELDRKEELRKKLMILQSEFDNLASDIVSFRSYLKLEGKGRDFEVVAAEWMEARKKEKEKQKANKGNAQPK